MLYLPQSPGYSLEQTVLPGQSEHAEPRIEKIIIYSYLYI